MDIQQNAMADWVTDPSTTDLHGSHWPDDGFALPASQSQNKTLAVSRKVLGSAGCT